MKLELVEISKEDFESLRGMSFGTYLKGTIGVQSKHSTYSRNGQEFFTYVEFSTYEEYLQYNAKNQNK